VLTDRLRSTQRDCKWSPPCHSGSPCDAVETRVKGASSTPHAWCSTVQPKWQASTLPHDGHWLMSDKWRDSCKIHTSWPYTWFKANWHSQHAQAEVAIYASRAISKTRFITSEKCAKQRRQCHDRYMIFTFYNTKT